MGRKQRHRHKEHRVSIDTLAIDEPNASLGDLFVILYGIAERLSSDPNAPDFIKEIVKGN